jgi:hypothetical protein
VYDLAKGDTIISSAMEQYIPLADCPFFLKLCFLLGMGVLTKFCHSVGCGDATGNLIIVFMILTCL